MTMAMAEEALLSSIEYYLENKRLVPARSKARRGELLVALPASFSAKVLLLNEMLVQGVGPPELARRMGAIPQNVNRLVDVRPSSKASSRPLRPWENILK